jgi:UTP--glucose-1-phosphate uridylyltransferase
MVVEGLEQARRLMERAGVDPTAIAVFAYSYRQLAAGETGLLSETDLDPVDDLPRLIDLEVDAEQARAALSATVVVKLNGGLGTSMGLDKAKSLLDVLPGRSFLDIIAEQVLVLRRRLAVPLPVIFMNSFRTSGDTMSALAAYPELAVSGLRLEFLQYREPKLRSDDLTPVSWPADPDLEWCPPGHGDIYTALYGSGLLQLLLDKGFRYVFVSNSDNLGARPDPRLAAWFAASGAPYAAELCRKTEADRKGGQLVRRRSDGQLIQRETAQTRPQDMDSALDASRHPFFHTNNLWIDLQALNEALGRRDGVLGLPILRNVKTVDPTDASSPEVIQIETAMGAAVAVFPGALAIEVDRGRFLPVKTTSDLLVLRSDAYELTEDQEVRLAGTRTAAPLVDLSSAYKLVGDFEGYFPHGAPSLISCDRFAVRGPWTFGRDVVVRGTVTVPADGAPGVIPDGTILQG